VYAAIHVGKFCWRDPTIVVAAVPVLPELAMMALFLLLTLAGFVAMRRRAT
jgi:hypothetical protein